MKKLILLAVCALALSSCSLVNKASKTNTNEVKNESEVETKSTTTTTEKIDTTVTVAGDSASVTSSLDKLLSGEALISGNEATAVEVRYDPVTKTVKAKAIAKPRKVPVSVNKTTTRVEDKKETTDASTYTKNEDKSYHKEPSAKGFMGGFLLWPLLVIIAIIVLYVVRWWTRR